MEVKEEYSLEICYIYDGSFEGLLTAVYDAYYSKIKPTEILEEEDFQPSLINEPYYIKTDSVKADKVHNAIRNKISEDALENIFYTYLSSYKGKGTLIYNYIKLGFKYENKVDLHTYDDTIIKIHKVRNRVAGEQHIMLGFVRFEAISKNLYYSSIEPDHNILTLIAPHFASRLADQNWIIHDLKREVAAIYNRVEWAVVPFEKNKVPGFKENASEDFYTGLWKDYFTSTAITNRINPKLQKMKVPIRYWKHMTEFK